MPKPARILCVVLSMVAMLVATAALSAAEAPLPAQAACRVTVDDRDGATSHGSGTLVDVRSERGLVITNWHVVKDAASDECLVIFADGRRHGAKIIRADRVLDLAALVIANPNREPARWTDTLEGETFRGVGFGPTPANRLLSMPGQITGHGGTDGQASIFINNEWREGDSGGGLFDERGRLCGVIWGAGNGEGCCVHPQQVAAFIVAAGGAPDSIAAAAGDAHELTQQCIPCQGQQKGQCYRLPNGSIVCPQQAQGAWRNAAPAVRSGPTNATPLAASPAAAAPVASCYCKDVIARMEARILELESRPPVQGEPGERGPAGPPGPAGAAGADAVFNADAVAAAVVTKLPPIRFIQRDAQTKQIVAEKLVPLGGELALNFGAAKQPIDARRSKP